MAYKRKRKPHKHKPTEAEIAGLAETFKPLRREGVVMVSWLREYASMLQERVDTEWTWAAVAQALTVAQITYQTGKPWTAKSLRNKITRALKPQRQTAEATAPQDKGPDVATRPEGLLPMSIPEFSKPGAQAQQPPAPSQSGGGPPAPPGAPAQPAPRPEPLFKSVSIREPPPLRQLTPEEEAAEAEVRRKLFGK
jgi:hypothetical protein